MSMNTHAYTKGNLYDGFGILLTIVFEIVLNTKLTCEWSTPGCKPNPKDYNHVLEFQSSKTGDVDTFLQ